MRAAFTTRTGPPEVIEVGELPRPVPGAGQVLVEMRAVSLNPIDCYARGGLLPGPLPNPWIPGRDLAGVVAELGPGVQGFQPGQRVWATNLGFAGRQGSFAEFCLVPQEWLFPLADDVSFTQAAAAALVGVTAHLGLVQRIGLQPGQTVFVRGAGGAVGNMVVQMAKAIGARVFASAGSDQKVDATLAAGADHVVNYRTADVAAELKQIHPEGVDVAWDTTRDPDLNQLVHALAERGQLILMAGREATPPFPVGPFYVKQCSVHGIIMLKMTPAQMAWATTDLQRWIGAEKIRPAIAVTLPLDQTVQAHRMQERSTLGLENQLAGKIVLVP